MKPNVFMGTNVSTLCTVSVVDKNGRLVHRNDGSVITNQINGEDSVNQGFKRLSHMAKFWVHDKRVSYKRFATVMGLTVVK